MTIQCSGCSALMQGPVLDRDHEWLIYLCPCCPRVTRIEASKADVARLNNVVSLSAHRARTGS